MTKYEIVLMTITFFTIIISAIGVLNCRRKEKQMLEHMNTMVNAAIEGKFSEEIFDESQLSSLETKLAHYLSATAVSTRNFQEEKDKVKELIADISHQTKTPISNILLYAQLLGEQNLPEESIPCVEALNAQGEKLRFLIDALVKISRLETGVFSFHPVSTKVAPMLDALLGQIARKAAEKQITISCADTDARGFFDGKWTGEALYNILDNAVKYTQAGGSVQITTTTYQLFCRIDILDTGMGIPEEEQAKIFGRFYRSPRVSETEGVGIGLYLARQIISGQGGYIRVSSMGKEGTCFSVFLPLQGYGDSNS